MSIADSPPAVTIGDLLAAMHYAGDSYSIHFRLCPARKRGDECQKCLDLDAAALAAEDRYMAARDEQWKLHDDVGAADVPAAERWLEGLAS